MSTLSFVFTLLLISTSSYASEMVGALSASQGGTGRAAIETNESLYLNPASIALANRFFSGVSYQSGFTGKDVSRNTYSIAFTDGSDGLMFPGSLGYRSHKINDRGRRIDEDEFKMGLGYRIASRLSVGLGFSHLRAKDSQGQRFNQNNFDLGFLIGLLPHWGLSFSGENLIEADETTPGALVRPSRVALGTQYIFQRSLTFRYETLMPLYMQDTALLGHRMGVGIAMKSNFYLNAGYSVDDAISQNWASVGLAWRGPRLKFAYSFQQEDRSELGVRHLVDLWFDI